jgi:hypothetical protein
VLKIIIGIIKYNTIRENGFYHKKTHRSQHLCEVNIMYLINFEFLESLELTIDYLEVVKLKNFFHLGAIK